MIDAKAVKHKREDEKVLNQLRIKESGTKEEDLELEILEEMPGFLSENCIAAIMGCSFWEIASMLEDLQKKKKIIRLSDGSVIHKEFWNQILDYTKKILTSYHEKNPILEGMDKEEFKSKLCCRFKIQDTKKGGIILLELDKRMAVKIKNQYVSDSKFSLEYSEELKNTYNQILEIYENAGVETPLTETVVQKFKDKKQAKQIIIDLYKEGHLVKLNSASFLSGKVYEQLLADIRMKIQKEGGITLGEFRDMCGTSRKYAVQFLEYLDKTKITKMVGDKRILL